MRRLNFSRGLAYLQLKKYSQAVEIFKKTAQSHPKSDRAHFFLGKVYLSLKQYDRAEKAFQETLKLNPAP